MRGATGTGTAGAATAAAAAAAGAGATAHRPGETPGSAAGRGASMCGACWLAAVATAVRCVYTCSPLLVGTAAHSKGSMQDGRMLAHAMCLVLLGGACLRLFYRPSHLRCRDAAVLQGRRRPSQGRAPQGADHVCGGAGAHGARAGGPGQRQRHDCLLCHACMPCVLQSASRARVHSHHHTPATVACCAAWLWHPRLPHTSRAARHRAALPMPVPAAARCEACLACPPAATTPPGSAPVSAKNAPPGSPPSAPPSQHHLPSRTPRPVAPPAPTTQNPKPHPNPQTLLTRGIVQAPATFSTRATDITSSTPMSCPVSCSALPAFVPAACGVLLCLSVLSLLVVAVVLLRCCLWCTGVAVLVGAGRCAQGSPWHAWPHPPALRAQTVVHESCVPASVLCCCLPAACQGPSPTGAQAAPDPPATPCQRNRCAHPDVPDPCHAPSPP